MNRTEFIGTNLYYSQEFVDDLYKEIEKIKETSKKEIEFNFKEVFDYIRDKDNEIEYLKYQLKNQKEKLNDIKEFIKENSCYDRNIKQCCRGLLTNECDYVLGLLEEIK